MNILIAPLHYIVDNTSGSEYTRSYEYVHELVRQHPSWSGDALVLYAKERSIGKIRIHAMLQKKPSFISIPLKLLFVFWVYKKARSLLSRTRYSVIWHQGPFAINETFSLLSLTNNNHIPMVLGPVYTPHIDEVKTPENYTEVKPDGSIHKPSLINRIDIMLYHTFAKYLAVLSQKSVSVISRIICIDEQGKALFAKSGFSNVSVLPLTVNAKGYTMKQKIRIKTPISLLTVSYLVEHKRTQDIIEALSILKRRYGSEFVHLTIVGDGPEKSKLVSLCATLSVSDMVTFIGHVPRTRVHTFYNAADMFVSASISDIMPGMYFEAMSAGLPMVLSENDTARDLKNQSFGGIVVPKQNPKAIATAIARIARSQSLYTRYSKENIRLMKTTYSFPANIKALANILENPRSL